MTTKNLPTRRRAGDDKDTYDVGYARLPVATRFKPGQSGNAKGRTKGSTDRKELAGNAFWATAVAKSALNTKGATAAA